MKKKNTGSGNYEHPPRCKAMTTNTLMPTRCSHPAQFGREYCHLHRKKEAKVKK